MNFADKLITLRRKSGMSQEQLADRLGVTRQSVSKWESGATLPELAKIIAISEMFEVSVDYLVKPNMETDWWEEVNHAGTNVSWQEERVQSDVAALRGQVENIENYFRGYEYVSKKKLGNFPLVCIRFSRTNRNSVARGIIAIGNIAVGVVAIGGLSLGVLSFGGLALGLAAIGALAAGIFSFGGVAFGIVALGSVAIGIYAGGTVAIAKEIAAGLAVVAEKTAIGRDVTAQYELQSYPGITKEAVRAFLEQHHPGLWKPLLELFSLLGT